MTDRGTSIMLAAWEALMFDHAVEIGEAFGQGASRMQGSLIPASKGCPDYRTVQMMAAPVLGTCDNCGTEMSVCAHRTPDRL